MVFNDYFQIPQSFVQVVSHCCFAHEAPIPGGSVDLVHLPRWFWRIFDISWNILKVKVAWQVLIFISLHDMNNPSEVLASTLPLLSPGDHHHLLSAVPAQYTITTSSWPSWSPGDHHHHVLLSAQCRAKKVEWSIMNNQKILKVELFLFWSSPRLSPSHPWCISSCSYSSRAPTSTCTPRCLEKSRQHSEVSPHSATRPLSFIVSLLARWPFDPRKGEYFHVHKTAA